MDEEISLADPLSYAEDVPYDEQVVHEVANSKSDDLKGRIGNRIYLIEDALTKKRKRFDEEVQGEEEFEDIAVGEDMADPSQRPNALLLHGPPISQMPTDKVFAYATHFDAHPIGLEWVDDQTCVLVFSSRKSALHAWDALQRPSTFSLTSEEQMQLDNMDQSFHVAHALPLALYPVEERISSALGKSKTDLSKQPIQIRWALKSDVKERGARNKSGFYKRFGETAGKPTNKVLPGYQLDDTRQNHHYRDEIARLDADMDQFLGEDDVAADSLKQRIGSRKGLDAEERRRQLDAELDRFLAGEDETDAVEPERNPDRRESLLERTGRRRSASPRRRNPLSSTEVSRRRRREPREETRVHTDSNGRWLHNAEIRASRRRMNYDSRVKGMRAWDDGGGDEEEDDDHTTLNLPTKKHRKTADELDRELEELRHR